MLLQVFERQGGVRLSNGNRKRFDGPIFQNAGTTDAALVKVFPKPDQVRWLGQRHLPAERLKDLGERVAVCGLRHIVAWEMNIDASAAQLTTEVSDALQLIGAT